VVSINSYMFRHRNAIFWGYFIVFYRVSLLVTTLTVGKRTVQTQFNPTSTKLTEIYSTQTV
jgi:hypothetical protein